MARKKGVQVVMVNTANKDVATTFKFVFGRHPDMTADEQRVIARILEFANLDLEGKLLKNEINNFKESDWGAVNMTLNVKDFILREGWEHDEVEDMLNRLARRSFTYEDAQIWTMATYISEPRYEKGSGKVSFTVPRMMWWAMKNFASGYRKFELNKALALPTTYSFRFYMLMSGQRAPFDMTIPTLFQWLGIPLEDHDTIDYKTNKAKHVKAPYRTANGGFRIGAIDEKVIQPAKEILDRTCPWSFKYEKLRKDQTRQRSQVIGYRFFPTYIDKNRDPQLAKIELEHKVGLGMLEGHLKNFLMYTCGYSVEEINRNRSKWLAAQESLDFAVIQQAWGKSRAKENPKAYFIKKIEGMITDAENKPQNVWKPKDEIDEEDPRQMHFEFGEE